MKRNILGYIMLVLFFNGVCVFAKEQTLIKKTVTKKNEMDIFNVHPWAVYLLYGNLADPKTVIIGVDLEAVERSNALANLKLISDGNWRGFIKDRSKFKYKIYKQFPSKCYVLHCADLPEDGSGSFGCYLVVKKEKSILYLDGKKSEMLVLLTKGVFYHKPSDKELKKIFLELKDENKKKDTH